MRIRIGLGLGHAAGPILASYRAIALGVIPVLVLVILFEILVPDSLLADQIKIPPNAGSLDLSRFVLFICVGTIHVLLCITAALLSISNVISRVAKIEVAKIVFLSIAVPTAALTSIFVIGCIFEPKIYRISYGRVISLMHQTVDFASQFSTCANTHWLRVFCASENLPTSMFCFLLIASGIVAIVSVCADIGTSSFHHKTMLTPKRLGIAGREMHDDINRYATSMLIVLTSSSLSISVFQLLGHNLLSPNSTDALLYQRAAMAASLFWPLSFSAIFLGIFAIPAWAIFEKRSEALRLLDAKSISSGEYDGFFAVRQAMPQSLRWMLLSGIPLIVSLAPRLMAFSG